jgi:[protein-PII] uridylyltransferase
MGRGGARLLVQSDARFARRFDPGAGRQAGRAARPRGRYPGEAMPGSAASRKATRWPCSRWAATGAANCSRNPTSTCWCWPNPTCSSAAQPALARFVALLWDAGLQASPAVRSAAECTEAAADQTVLTALIEARPLVAGKRKPRPCARRSRRTRMAAARVPGGQGRRAAPAPRALRRYLGQPGAEHQGRAGRPARPAHAGLAGPAQLRRARPRRAGGPGPPGPDEAIALERERRVLCRLRYGLHLVAGRREERLRFDYQKLLAARLGYEDDGDSLAVEKMMQGFYRSAAIVRRINDRLLQRFEEHFDGSALAEPIDGDFERRRGYLATRVPGWLLRDPANVFALFATWAADTGLRGLHSQTARELAQALPGIPAYTDVEPTVRARFMALLRGPQPVKVLERMARLGVLGRWIPAFAEVSGRMQFDLFHVYTVDQHTLAVLKNLAAFASGQGDPRFSIAHRVWPSLRKPELLLLAGLFHDIGKGRGGDHSELGAVDARAFCEAHDLSEADTAQVEWLVRSTC